MIDMSNFDDEYYVVQKVPDDRVPSLTADENTVRRNYTFEPQSLDSSPFIFIHAGHEYAKKLGVTTRRELPEVLFNGTLPIVGKRIRDAFVALEIPSLHLHPAVFIDDDGVRHEDRWLMGFSKRFDCWDRERSDYEDEPLILGGHQLYSVYSYRLNAELLGKVPLAQRLLFQMGGSQDPIVVCHQSVAEVFGEGKGSGAVLTPITRF